MEGGDVVQDLRRKLYLNFFSQDLRRCAVGGKSALHHDEKDVKLIEC